MVITADGDITIEATAETEADVRGRASANSRDAAGDNVDYALTVVVGVTRETAHLTFGATASATSTNGSVQLLATGRPVVAALARAPAPARSGARAGGAGSVGTAAPIARPAPAAPGSGLAPAFR